MSHWAGRVTPKQEDRFMPHVDLVFRVSGGSLPVDHGYALYSAIKAFTA